MVAFVTESTVERMSLEILSELGYATLHGPEIGPGELLSERATYADVVLEGRLRDAVDRLNPDLPPAAREEAVRQVLRMDSPSLVENNRRFHRMLVDGVTVEVPTGDGEIRGEQVRLVDYADVENNDFVAINQFSVKESDQTRRPDVVVFVNGLPIAVIELKNPASENATIWSAYNQLQTYKSSIPSFFTYNELLIVSDGTQARMGSLTASTEWFLPWRTVDGENVASVGTPELATLLRGVFRKDVLLDLISGYVVFEDASGGAVKKVAAYHQFHATRKAVESAVSASRPTGDRRAGVVWHTQGSGKSLTMLFFAGRLITRPELENPTIVVLTDRNDLDDQLHATFARGHELLRQTPVQSESREEIRRLLKVASGGVVFTTVQKFFPDVKGDVHPLLSDRRNIVVIADEAHRSQYDFIDGFARHMRDALPNATFVGFTGTPIERDDRNTISVFGDHIDVYDITRAVEDGATVRIYYESRLAKIDLNESERPHIDEQFDEVTESEEANNREKLKSKWAQIEKVVGTQKRLALVAEDLVKHYEERCGAMDGKAMIVCMSRRICVDMYNEITKIRPDWHADTDDAGRMKIVMTGSATDPVEWQQHIRNKQRREALANRFKDPADPFRIVIVRDMWLTGFDAPCLHTMYLDKPMHGHNLMQAIARVNRVFRDKPGGLVVDYIGLADSLKKALATYTQSGGKGKATLDQAEAVAIMLEKYEIVRDFFHGFEYRVLRGTISEEARLTLIKNAQDHILARGDSERDRYQKTVTELSKAFALSVPHPDALAIRDEVAFFQSVKASLTKITSPGPREGGDVDAAIRQIVSSAVVPDRVIDILETAGLDRPEISILSDEFLADVREMPQRNLAVEALRRLLEGELKTRSRRNLVEAKSFAEMLEKTINRYRNRAIETTEVIEELIELAKKMREANKRGEKLGLSDDEVAFYDALETNDSAVQVLGDDTLKGIARELTETLRKNVTIDWTVKETVQARLRVMVKRVLRKHGYPPDKRAAATIMVLKQAETLCDHWTEAA